MLIDIKMNQRRLQSQLMEVFKYLIGHTNVNSDGLIKQDCDERTCTNGQKLKH